MEQSDAWDDPSIMSAVAELKEAEAFFMDDDEVQSSGGMQPLEFDSRPVSSSARSVRSSVASSSPAQAPSTLSRGAPVELVTSGTLDEPVLDTILREVKQVTAKIAHVMMPYESQAHTLDHLRDWDLWGPLIIGLLLALLLSVKAKSSKRAETIFALVFVVIWCGAAVVTLNAALLGGSIMFWQSVCVLGYSVFPLCVACALSILGESLFDMPKGFRVAIVIPALIWCTKVSVVFIGEVIVPERRALAVYPVLGFYCFLAWMVVSV